MGGMGSIKVLYPILIVYALSNWKYIEPFFKPFKKERNYFIFFILFSFSRAIIGGDFVVAYQHVILLIENFILPICLLALFYKGWPGIDQSFSKAIMIVGCVAASISFACFVNPQIQEIVKNQLQSWGSGGYLSRLDYRGFGLGESLTYSYGIVQGIILGLGILLFKNYKWIVVFIPCFLVSILLNARTGIFISIAALLISILSTRGFKKWIYLVLGAAVAYGLVIVLLQAYGIDEDQLVFVKDFGEQLEEVEESGVRDNTGAIGYLSTEHIVWPSSIDQWILGRGYILYDLKGVQNTDSGFFQQLNYGGLLYFIPLLLFVILIVKKMLRYKVAYAVVILFIVAFIIANFKGNLFLNSGGFRLMLIFYYSLIMNKMSNIILKKQTEISKMEYKIESH